MKRLVFLIGLTCLILAGSHSVWAHDVYIGGDASTSTNPILFNLDDTATYSIEHVDENPYKGWAGFWVRNIGAKKWGDFHIDIIWKDKDKPGFIETKDDNFLPYSSIVGWNRDNWEFDYIYEDGSSDIIGASIDFYFYNNPISTGTAYLFKIYTNNVAHKLNFDITAYPTPVPIPGAIWFLGSGILAIIGSRKKSKQK